VPLTNEQCYEIWAPDDGLWSAWAKPVLFAEAPPARPGDGSPTEAAPEPARLPDARRDRAVVVDLPGAESVLTGIALARRGFRPVPLYNGNAAYGLVSTVPAEDIAHHLFEGAEVLREQRLAPDAPPAFLLDANRERGKPVPGAFDNRWVVLPQDFPSATFLLAHGVREVLVLQRSGLEPDTDLAHVLLRWQRAGVRLSIAALADGSDPVDLVVRPPSLFRHAWYGAIALLGLRRSNIGGFGARVPKQTSWSGAG
jgi:hypothetical protein